MQKIPKGIIAIAIVLVLTVLVYYRYTLKMLPAVRTEETSVFQESVVAEKPRQVSAVVTYEVTGYDITHEARFTLELNTQGVIEGVKLVENPTGEASDKQAEFATGLLTVIKGKKLSELTPVDRIGKSTLTTDAFNSVIDTLKAQL
jgi:hypothetical protein